MANVTKSLECRRCGQSLTYETLQDLPDFPFCSRRCKFSDLGRWFDEEYTISKRIEEQGDEDLLERTELGGVAAPERAAVGWANDRLSSLSRGGD